MPGIVGIISRQPPEVSERLVKSMAATMRHEPFHSTGIFSAPELGLCAGWIAPEKSFAAGQPFCNAQNNVALVFAGECFFDPGSSATGGARLVPLYEKLGENFFAELNGLFSSLLIDRRQRKIFLFNDRYGVERIYWHETADAFYFASEAKALLRILPELREFDQEGVAQFMAFGSTLAGRTLFRGVSLLPGGSLCTFADGKCVRGKYFSPAAWESQPKLNTEDFEVKFSETFKKILPRYFASESRVGISLTAGLDTRMIMACRPASAQTPVCYTFDETRRTTFDTRLAARVASACGLEHHVLRIGPDFFSDFAAHADRTVYISDGYFGVTGAHEIYLNRLARNLSPVRLAGAFGGEILREVSTFKLNPVSQQIVRPEFRPLLEMAARPRANSTEHPVTFAAFKEIPWNIFGSPAMCRSQLNFRTPFLDNEIVSLAYRMPENLRHGSELVRHVVKDHNDTLTHIPTDMGHVGKMPGLRAASRRLFCKTTFKLDYFYNEGMPGLLSPMDSVFGWCASRLGIVGLHKYLHYRRWFRDELAAYVNDAVAACLRQESPFWNSDALARMAREHVAGRGNYVLEINSVLTLNAVERLLFRQWPN